MAQASVASKDAGITYLTVEPGARVVIVAAEREGAPMLDTLIETAHEAFPDVPAGSGVRAYLPASAGYTNHSILPPAIGDALDKVLEYYWSSEQRDFEEDPDEAHIYLRLLLLSRWLGAPAGDPPQAPAIEDALAQIRERVDA